MGYRGRSYYAWLLGSAAAIAISSAASAADNAQFDIAPQPLASALNEFSLQSHQSVLFTTDLASAKSSQGVSGQVQVADALSSLLAGTGLTWKKQGDTFLIVSASDPQSGSAAGDGADAGTVAALVVTAQKREENIQDVPIAMSAFTQEDLTKSQVAGGPDLMTQVPNFTFTKTNFSGYSIQIRGIGTQAISATVDPAVAVAFNNTPFIRNRFFEQEFYDLERIEVLRGPQGTLYGRNATAGVVNIISAKPKHHFEAKASADIANYGSTRLEGMLNLPLFEDKAALRIAGAWTKRDGYVTNTLTGQQTDGRDLWSTRVTLGLEPTDRFSANLIWEHFEENDDRLRSGKQLCHKDPGPTEIAGVPILPTMPPIPGSGASVGYFSQGCLPASLYSPDSFETPNGFALPYGPAARAVGAPVADAEIYESAFQSRDLREIETRLTPEYEASTDTVELQMSFDLPHNLTLASETGYSKDTLFSFQDFNRFSTKAGSIIEDELLAPDGIVCSPQIGCSDRVQAGDLSTARSQNFNQELRVSSDYEGRFNFSLGANFLRYDTEDKYYVFLNTLGNINEITAWCEPLGVPELTCGHQLKAGYQLSDVNNTYWVPTYTSGIYKDTGDIHHLNDLGRNYFLSKNPYNLISYAVFGEAYYNFTDNLKLTLGLRLTDDRKEAPQIPSWLLAGGSYGLPTRKTIRQEWREPTGRVAIDWKPQLAFTDETLLYASYVRGYKAGGANPPPAMLIFSPISCDECNENAVLQESLTHPETFKAEYVDAYELGTKNTLLDGRLTFNLNGFYYDYRGYQISQIVDRAAVNLNFDAKVWGAEIEMDWRPAENRRFAFKGGYEKTRMADGSKAIDLMDRTAGVPGWVVHKPFPTHPSSCIVPVAEAWHFTGGDFRNALVCTLYKAGAFFWDVPNNGEGFDKDLSGNELPNAPHFTATLTADYTLPMPSGWLATLHTDLYYQSEAWARVFNTPGYDKLKAYNNINVAAIFTNEDRGWTIMAYVKNVLDKDNITGAFLNSDDTGLTTNVFLNEPRLYGLRMTKAWSGSDWWSAHANQGGHNPYRLELYGDYGRISGGREIMVPATVALFEPDQPYPIGVQNDLDWGSGGGVRFTYQARPKGWSLAGGVRYGRARGSAQGYPEWHVPGGFLFNGKYYVDPSTGRSFGANYVRYASAKARNEESHTMADFSVGADVGLGADRLQDGHLEFGLGYAKFRSSSNAELHGRPDVVVSPDDIVKYGSHWHRFWAELDAKREFEGAGPSLSWTQSLPLLGDAESRVDADFGLGGSVLFGRQSADVSGMARGDYNYGVGALFNGGIKRRDAYDTTFSYSRSRAVTVPSINASLGVSYTIGGLKLTSGYRWERYFNAIDAGIAERKTYDRQFDGPYMKVSVDFGG